MKKILALVSFLLVASACANQTSTNPATNSNASTPTTKSAAPSEADMIAKEKAAWDALKKKDYDAFGNMITSDYLEVTDEGVFDKTSILKDIKDFDLTDATESDWKLLPVNNDAAILTYQVTLKGKFKGNDVPPGPYRAAAAWVNRDGKWLALFYQQTAIKIEPAAATTPAPSASKPEKAAPSPASKVADTGPDPIANEKIVWELFRAGNADGFAALLDPAFVELEANAVYGKAEAIKIAGFDFTQFEESEWKSAKLNDDAALVTYLVKSKDPKMDPERHTTIWAKRGGKWLGILHIGTPVAKPAAK
jgi:hypothetical protein